MAAQRSKQQLAQQLAQAREELAALDPAGKMVRIRGLMEDISDRNRVEQALLRERAVLDGIMKATDVMLVYLDRDFNFVAVNPAYAETCRMRPEDMIGRNHFEMYPHEENQAIFRQVRDTGVPVFFKDKPFEFPDQPERGVTYWDWSLTPVKDASGYVVGMVFSLRETTRYKQAEEALRRSEQRLKELNATLEQRIAERTAEAEHRAAQLQRLAAELTNAEQRERKRLAQVLHDHLQQLLVGAKLSLGRARGCVPDGAINEILRQSDQLISDSLATSRSLTAELSPMILHEGTMPDILRWLARWARQKYGLSVRVRVSQGADVEAAEVRVVLFGAVRELLLNVVKHAGVKQARIGMRCGDGRRVQVVVADSGAGFDAGAKEGRPSGSGFGLFSIQERLDLLGGRCHVASRPGHGTRVSLVVARQLQAEAPEGPRRAMPVSPAVAQGEVPRQAWSLEHPIRVLLADDHAVVRNGMASLLQLQPDIQVIGQAADGQQAIDLASQLRPDVILMDVSMPRVGGIEATRQIMRQVPGTRIIGLSMFVQEDVAAQMTRAGAVAYLTKTSAPETVIATIYQCTNRASVGDSRPTRDVCRRV